MDLGECLKVHDLALRADYEIASKEQDFFFELDVRFVFELFMLYNGNRKTKWQWEPQCMIQTILNLAWQLNVIFFKNYSSGRQNALKRSKLHLFKTCNFHALLMKFRIEGWLEWESHQRTESSVQIHHPFSQKGLLSMKPWERK